MQQPPLTSSSRLLSSSKFLNHAGLRDWCARDMLRRNGPDQTSPAGGYQVIRILEDDLQGDARVEQLLTEERKRHAGLEAWLSRAHIPTFGAKELKDLPEKSLGKIFYNYIVEKNFELDFHPDRPLTQYALTRRMRSRNHDIEHILLGAGFDYLDELIPAYFCLTQLSREFSPELAGELSQLYIMIALRYTVRTVLHYPRTWPTAMACIQRGIRVGKESDFLYMVDYQPYLHLSVPEAREALGVRGVVEASTEAASLEWADASHRALIEAAAQHAVQAAE